VDLSETLFHLFMELPPNLKDIERVLNDNRCTNKCISESFCKFAEECFCEYSGFIEQHNRKPLNEEIHSTYIFPLCNCCLNMAWTPTMCLERKTTNPI